MNPFWSGFSACETRPFAERSRSSQELPGALRALVQSEHQTPFELTGKGFEEAAHGMVKAGLTHGCWACCDGRFSVASQKSDRRTGGVVA